MSEFDNYASRYQEMRAMNVKYSGYSPEYFDEYKVRCIYRDLDREHQADRPLSILNFGCGIGNTEPFLARYLPNATVLGVDVSMESLRLARHRNEHLPRISYCQIDEEKSLTFNTKFDVIFVANVFHHIPHQRHESILRDLFGALNQKGSVFMFEHNPYNPFTLWAVRNCPLDDHADLLTPTYAHSVFRKAGFSRIRTRFTLFIPRILSALSPLESFLRWVPFGAQYYVHARN